MGRSLLTKQTLMKATFRSFCLIAALLLTFGVVHGQDFDTQVMVLKGGNDRVVLEPKPCTSRVLALVREEFKARMRQITYILADRQSIPGCAYVDKANGVVYGIFEDGDTLMLPMDKFAPGDGLSKLPRLKVLAEYARYLTGVIGIRG